VPVREKLTMAGFVVLLVAVWGVGFLWVRGDLNPSAKAAPDKPASSAATDPSASAEPAPASPSASASDGKYTGKVAPEQERKQVDVNPDPIRPRPRALPPVAQFTVATFNLLGSSHTRQSGKNPSMASGPQRMGGALQILASHGVSVVGFQEFQPDQRRVFQSRAKGWAMYPGLSMGGGAGENSVAWRTDTWDLIKPATVPIPYFNGRQRPMPFVLLRHKQTGVQAYFSTFHNPADTRQFRNQGRFRSAATGREINLFKQLETTGIPQLVTGDFNDRAQYFCRVTGSTGLIAAAGGSNSGRCLPPPRMQVDWIFGSPGLQFSGYTIDRGALVRRTTDHAVVVSQVTVDALKFKNAYTPTPTTP
jgi:hypothetical protein